MGKILDYHCIYDWSAGLVEWSEKNPVIRFPEAYCRAEMIAELAQTIRRHTGAAFCVLPFCHTLEAEAYGAEINLGDGLTGPRAGNITKPIQPEDLSFHWENPRLNETLQAIELLKAQGENVLFQVSGPLTILNSLLPQEKLFRMLLKEPEKAMELFHKIGEDSLKLMKCAEKAGADILSFADPMGGVNIVGPKIAERIAVNFTADFLKKSSKTLDRETMILLCPKTALALLGSEQAEWKEHQLEKEMSYGEAALQMKGKIRFGGQCCVKKTQPIAIFKELILR